MGPIAALWRTRARLARDSLERHEVRIAIALALAYLVAYTALSILRHQSFRSTAFDLAVFDQIFWNTTQGRPFESTMDRGICEPHSFLGGHFSPFLTLLLPFYALIPRAETLLVLQTAAIASGALPVYLLARSRFAPGWQRLTWVVVYFLIVPLAYMNLFDFHTVAFAILPLGLALYFLELGRRRAFLVSLFASFLVKEELPLVALGFAAYVLVGKRDWRTATVVAAASIAWFVFAVKVAIPFFNAGAAYRYIDFYERLGRSELEILRTVLADPATTFEVLRTDAAAKLRYVLVLFGPGLGAAVLSGWGLLLAGPSLAYTLLSGYPPQYALENHYSATLIPLALGTSMIGLSRLRASLRPPAVAGVLVASLALSFGYGDLPFSRTFDASRFRADGRYATFMPELAVIPAQGRVLAQDHVASQIARRRYLNYYGFQHFCKGIEWIVLDYADRNFVKRDRVKHRREIEGLERVGFEQVARGDGLALLRRRPVGGPGRDPTSSRSRPYAAPPRFASGP